MFFDITIIMALFENHSSINMDADNWLNGKNISRRNSPADYASVETKINFEENEFNERKIFFSYL